MNKQKLKLIVRNLELLVDSLKEEIDSDEKSNLNYKEITHYLENCDDDIEYYDENED
jgi:hypothetical protein